MSYKKVRHDTVQPTPTHIQYCIPHRLISCREGFFWMEPLQIFNPVDAEKSRYFSWPILRDYFLSIFPLFWVITLTFCPPRPFVHEFGRRQYFYPIGTPRLRQDFSARIYQFNYFLPIALKLLG